MVQTKDYKTKNNTFLTINNVKNSDKKIATILPGSGWTEFSNEEETIKKPWVTIELDGEQLEWTLNKTTNERLGEEIGSFETDDWVGAQIKLLVDKRGDQEFITATVISSDYTPEEVIEEEAPRGKK